MLKLFIGLLLLVNLGLYGYNAGYLGANNLEGREPARVNNQINTDRLRRVETAPQPGTPAAPAIAPRLPLVPTAAAPALPTAAATAALGLAATSNGAGAATAGTPILAQTAPAMLGASNVVGFGTSTGISTSTSCIEVGNFDAPDARRFEAQLAPLALGERLARRSVQELERHIVYIPPALDKEGADRKAAELRRLGIDDFYVIQDNTDLRWGISLGMFKTPDAARLHLANLTQKGVRTAKITARPGINSKTAFQLRALDAAGQATLAQIRLGFPRQDIRTCAPAGGRFTGPATTRPPT